MSDGALDVEKSANGYRWVFTAPSGAMHIGGQWYRTKKAAIEAGEQWRKDYYA